MTSESVATTFRVRVEFQKHTNKGFKLTGRKFVVNQSITSDNRPLLPLDSTSAGTLSSLSFAAIINLANFNQGMH
jgi:hypothetical protein